MRDERWQHGNPQAGGRGPTEKVAAAGGHAATDDNAVAIAVLAAEVPTPRVVEIAVDQPRMRLQVCGCFRRPVGLTEDVGLPLGVSWGPEGTIVYPIEADGGLWVLRPGVGAALKAASHHPDVAPAVADKLHILDLER